MKKISLLFIALFMGAFVFQSCEDQDDNEVPVSDFVWKGLNLYYLWKDNVPNLADNRFSNQAELNGFLQSSGSPENLFHSLLYNPGVVDKWSVIFPDYRVLENALQGVATSNGVEFGLRFVPGSETDVFGYVRYILPGTDAATKDIHRGDIFYAVNGTPLTINNYQNLLSQNTYTLNLATYTAGVITPNGESVQLTKAEYAENPVYFTNTYTQNGHTFGYLMYNGFYSNYNDQLNAAFAQMKSQNITDLVLDLRYNGGGSVRTATYLGSMITGQFSGQLFSKQQYNSRVQAHYESTSPDALRELFTAQMNNGQSINSLGLSKVYILTTQSTASASELLINCLSPYIDVVVIGDTTTGKNVGSITLYDSDDFSRSDLESNYAMQPIVLRTLNKDNFGDYSDGIDPDVDLPENMENLGQIGDINEPLFAAAINLITGSGRRVYPPGIDVRSVNDSKGMRRFGNEMYIEKAPDGIIDLKNPL